MHPLKWVLFKCLHLTAGKIDKDKINIGTKRVRENAQGEALKMYLSTKCKLGITRIEASFKAVSVIYYNILSVIYTYFYLGVSFLKTITSFCFLPRFCLIWINHRQCLYNVRTFNLALFSSMTSKSIENASKVFLQ